MTIVFNHTYKYTKGDIYSPDAIELMPRYCNKYFEVIEESHGKEYEQGTVRCLKSFEITIKIKE